MRLDHLSRQEVYQLLTVARAESERDWLLILVTYWHGLRASEAVQLRPTDVRDGYLRVRRLKGSLPTTQALLEDADPLLNEAAALREYRPQGLRPFNLARVEFYRRFHRYCLKAGIPAHKAHPHSLKHSIAMHSLRSGVGIDHVRQYLGHKHLNSTGAYLRVGDEEASRAVVSALTRRMYTDEN